MSGADDKRSPCADSAARPTRVRLRRTKGYRKPADAVVVARPSKWGNPFSVKHYGEVAVEMFENRLRAAVERPYTEPHDIEFRIMAESIGELRGKDLACWCRPGEMCHADVLIDLANAPQFDGYPASGGES